MVPPYNSSDTATDWTTSHFLSDKLDFHLIDNLSIAYPIRMLSLLSVDEVLESSYVNRLLDLHKSRSDFS